MLDMKTPRSLEAGPQRALLPAAQDVDQEAIAAAQVHEGLPGGLSPVRLSLPPRGSKVNRKSKVSLWCALPWNNSHTRPRGLQCSPRRGGEASERGGPTQATAQVSRGRWGRRPAHPRAARARTSVSHPEPTLAGQLWARVLQVTVSSFQLSLSSSGFVYFEEGLITCKTEITVERNSRDYLFPRHFIDKSLNYQAKGVSKSRWSASWPRKGMNLSHLMSGGRQELIRWAPRMPAPGGVSVLTSNLEKIELLLVHNPNLFYIHIKAPCKT